MDQDVWFSMTTVTPKAASRRQKTPEVPKLHSVYRILAKVVLKMILVKALPSRLIWIQTQLEVRTYQKSSKISFGKLVQILFTALFDNCQGKGHYENILRAKESMSNFVESICFPREIPFLMNVTLHSLMLLNWCCYSFLHKLFQSISISIFSTGVSRRRAQRKRKIPPDSIQPICWRRQQKGKSPWFKKLETFFCIHPRFSSKVDNAHQWSI